MAHPVIGVFVDTAKHIDHNVTQWVNYNDIYINDVQGNPRAKQAMHNDPGVKFMRHGWWILCGFFFIIYLIGCFANKL